MANWDHPDRLLDLLSEIDVGKATDPRLDRTLDFQSPKQLKGLLGFESRGGYDTEILTKLYDDLPWNHTGNASGERFTAHQSYVAMAKRRHFFERMDDAWRKMLPYRSAENMPKVVRGETAPAEVLPTLLRAINLGEGLTNPQRLEGQVGATGARCASGAVRSYRLFPSVASSLWLTIWRVEQGLSNTCRLD
ncbi:MAG: hypothetical protein R3C56_37090 [Pirellulaceae bacterium]